MAINYFAQRDYMKIKVHWSVCLTGGKCARKQRIQHTNAMLKNKYTPELSQRCFTCCGQLLACLIVFQLQITTTHSPYPYPKLKVTKRSRFKTVPGINVISLIILKFVKKAQNFGNLRKRECIIYVNVGIYTSHLIQHRQTLRPQNPTLNNADKTPRCKHQYISLIQLQLKLQYHLCHSSISYSIKLTSCCHGKGAFCTVFAVIDVMIVCCTVFLMIKSLCYVWMMKCIPNIQETQIFIFHIHRKHC